VVKVATKERIGDMDNRDRQDRALAIFEAAGIELQNSKPDNGPRRWFAGPSSPTIHGFKELELVAAYLELALRERLPS
jgi:hypothetical protein